MPVLTPRNVFAPGREPPKSEIIQLFEQFFGAATAPGVVTLTAAALDLITPAAETYGGLVLNDPDPTKNGYYYRSGGNWVWGRGLPDTLAVLDNVGGTGNAITAETLAGVNPANVLGVFLPSAAGTNGAGGVTISLNGGAVEPVKTSAGGDLAPGDIVEGVGTFLFRFGSEWRQMVSSRAGATFDHQGDWDAERTYIQGQFVTGSNGNWYQLKATSSIDDDPVSSVSGDWVLALASAAIADGSLNEPKYGTGSVSTRALAQNAVSEPKLADELALSLTKICYTRAELKAVDTDRYRVAYLAEPGYEGLFVWDGSDLSNTMVRRTNFMTAAASTDILAMPAAISTSIDAATNVITISGGVPWAEDDELVCLTTANGVYAGGKYFAYNVTATTLQVRTSLTAGALDLTGATALSFTAPHKVTTGEACTVGESGQGLVAGTIYYFIRNGAGMVKVASTYQNARNGVAMDITGDGAVAVEVLIDPLGGRCLLPIGADIRGSDGAWVRQDDVANSRHFGAKGDGSADDGHALQASVWLGRYLRMPTYTPRGHYMTSTPITHESDDWLYDETIIQRADNGIIWRGDGREISVIECSGSFPNSTFLVTLDGNVNGLAHIVGSRSMAQTSNSLQGLGFRGRGVSTGTNVSGVFVRGCWEMRWADLDFESFTGNMVEQFTGAPSSGSLDEVDNTAFWTMERCRFQYGGARGLKLDDSRVAALAMRDCQVYSMVGTGMVAALVNSEISNCYFTKCGNRADTSTGGLRLNDSGTGSLCRNNVLNGVHCEENFNYEFQFIGCRSLTAIECSVNMYAPAGADVVNKCGVRITSIGAGTTTDLRFVGGYFQDYSASYEMPYFDIGSGVEGVNIDGVKFIHPTSHIKAVSPVRLTIDHVPSTVATTFTGSAPVECFKNYVAI